MIRENALGKKNSRQCVCLRYIGKFLMPIVSVCCMQAWAEDEPVFSLESAPGETNTVAESGTYTASQDLTFGALKVAASPVTFDFSATPSRKVVFNGTSAYAVEVEKSGTTVTFKGGEWGAADGTAYSIRCGYRYVRNNQFYLDNCVWTNLYRVYVGRSGENCKLTLDNNSRVYAKQCFLMYQGSAPNSELAILGGSGLFLSPAAAGDPSFYSDNGEGPDNGLVTVAGDKSVLYAPNNEFIVGRSADNHLMVVSNNSSAVVGNLVVGRNDTVTGSKVLVADNAELTVKTLSVRNPGNSVIVSNATLAVDSTANDAIKVGYEGRTGGSFVLSGESAVIDYSPAGNVEVFAQNSGNAEFRIENGASWKVVGNQIAAKTSNSVFRIASDGKFEVDGKMQFGPAGDTNGDPATSLSNRLEVCEGGNLVIGGLRFSGHGNMLVVSNGYISSTDAIQIGYNRSGKYSWAAGLSSKDCALVMCGESGQIDAADVALQVLNGSVLRFEVPEDGYESDIIPLKVNSLSFADGTKMEIDCEAFMYRGGKVTLVEVTRNDGFENANNMIAAVNESLPQGCYLSVIGKKLMLMCSKRRFVFSIR